VEDGTEHDYDSHIMVWQLAVQQTSSAALAPAREPLRRLPPASASSSLRSSSSLGLGPTPGSNLALDSQSEYGGLDSDQEEGEDGGDLNASDSLTVLTSRRPSPSSPSSTTVGTAAAASHSGSSSVEAPYSSIETGTDPLDAAWNKDVESMLNNPPPLDTFQSFMLSSEPSLSSWVVPPTASHFTEDRRAPTASHFTEERRPDYSPFGFATRRRQQGGKSRSSPPEPGEDFTHHFSPGMLEK
jgi:hypothetical protein